MDVKLPPMRRGDPTWSMALRYPRQGYWTASDFFELEGESSKLKELANGYLEILPMPTLYHQDIAIYMLDMLREYLKRVKNKGRVSLAPCPVRFSSKLIREPDLFYLSEERLAQTGKYPRGLDWVLEIVSGSKEDRKRDFITKRREYAKAGIREYWIVDPKYHAIHVLALNEETKSYVEHGKFTLEHKATSVMFTGFSVAVSEVFKKR